MITAPTTARSVPMKRALPAGLAVALVLTIASTASATRILGATNPGNQMGSVQSLLDLGNDIAGNDIGNTLQLVLEEDGPVIVTFSAECAVDGSEQQWVSIELLADGNALSPTAGDQDTFCSGNSFAGFNDQWVMASMTVPAELAAGSHDLQVQVTPAGGAAGWWIGDLALTVVVQKR